MMLEPLEVGGVTFPPNTVVIVCAFAGNRDPEVYVDPDRFDILAPRASSARMLTFGAGVHYCVGANLARAELTEALTFLAARVERIEPAGDAALQSVSGIYGVDELPLRLLPAV